MAKSKDRFWWGPVTSERTALRIIDAAGWIFVGFGVLAAIGAFRGSDSPAGAPPFVEATVIFLLLAVPAAFLISRKTRAAAIAMMIVAGLMNLLMLLPALALLTNGFDLAMTAIGLAMVAFWLMLFLLSWRGFQAASALRRLKAQAAG